MGKKHKRTTHSDPVDAWMNESTAENLNRRVGALEVHIKDLERRLHEANVFFIPLEAVKDNESGESA